MTEMKKQTRALGRAAPTAWRTHTRGRAILAVALVAACDGEPVVAPPEAVVSASGSSATLSAAATSDPDILIALYEATDGPNWLNNENWLTDAPLGSGTGWIRMVQAELSGWIWPAVRTTRGEVG